MFRTHLKFFVRVFLKDKFFSILNILGLALGIAVSILLLLILQNDFNYDKHYANYERIYRLGGHLTATGIDSKVARSARELAAVLKDEFPEIEATTRVNDWDHTLVKYENGGTVVSHYEEDIVRADSTYFNVFDHPFIAGDKATCLALNNNIVLTESAAKKYFGNESPLDKSLIIDNEDWKVTAVIRDLPPNTHLKFDFLLSGLSRTRGWVMDQGAIKSEAFWNPDVYTYLLMTPGYNPKNFTDKFPNIYTKFFKSFGDQVGGHYDAILQPLADIHFSSSLNGDEPVGNIAYVYAFTGIGIFIMLLACINYMNLSTAKAAKRATEIAMKKTLGSNRSALVYSLLGESIFMSFASLVIAVVLIQLLVNLSSFNQLIDRQLSFNLFSNPVLLLSSLGITLLIGLLAGLYPAIQLPSIPTLSALKGAFRSGKSAHAFRKILITVQFAISIFVVTCTFFMRDQIDFMRDRDLGFNQENILVLPIEDTLVMNQMSSIKSQFLQQPNILAATTSYNVPGMGLGGPVMLAEGADGEMKQQRFTMIQVGEDYFKTMGIKILKGRDFQTGPKQDVDDIFMCNEAAAKLMGWGDDPVGKKVKWFHGERNGQVIAMVNDFNFSSLHNSIEPLLIVKQREPGGFLHLRISGNNLPETVASIEKKWRAIDPNHPYESFFLDERFNEQYRADEVQYKLLTNLSYICIFISLLGLLGLSAFSAAQRTKEIGIRKVHGASVPKIIYLLFRDVMFLVIAASVVIVPPVYLIINKWMSNFAYRTSLNYTIFFVVAGLALVFAFLTVAFHSMKVARTNPVKALKYE